MKSRKTRAFGETHISDSFLCKLPQWHKYIKHLELLDCCCYSAQWQKNATETNAEEILEKKKKVKWRWCRKVWSAIALPAKSGHRRPLYFNLCSLSRAEEQQLLQSEQRRRGCQQSRREGSPYACYPAERRKSRKRKASPAGTPHCKNRFWLARAKVVLLHEFQQYWYGTEVKKHNMEKELKYIHIHAHKHTCIYKYKSKHANIHCPH